MAKAIKTSWSHMRRSPYQSFAAIFIMLQTFFVITIFAFVVIGSARVITYFESLPRIIAFFKDETKQSDITSIENQLKQSGKVASLKFVSKDEAFQRFSQKYKDNPLMLDFVSPTILPSSIEVSAISIDDLSGIYTVLKQSPFVEDIQNPADITNRLKSWTGAIRKIGIVMITVLALDAIFLMVIIIGIKVSHKRQEIEIMRLLSATNWYIRWPFLLEGIIYSVIGAILGFALATGGLFLSLHFLQSFLGDASLIPTQPIVLAEVLGIELVAALLLGSLASFLALVRYLK